MSSSTPAVKSAERALALLEYLSKAGPTSFTDLLVALELPRSSGSGLLATLESSGWIERDVRRRYIVGLRAWQVGRSYRGHEDLANLAGPVMDRLAISTGETVQLARLDGTVNVYIGISLSPSPMRLASSVGMRLPSHATGIGKALLCQLDRDERERRMRSVTLERYTDHTITDIDVLLERLDLAEQAGFAVDDEEYVEGCRCVAVPLGVEELGLTAALSVTSPSFRTPSDWPTSTLDLLKEAARDIRSELGLASGYAPLEVSN